jgi:hypothetical protein
VRETSAFGSLSPAVRRSSSAVPGKTRTPPTLFERYACGYLGSFEDKVQFQSSKHPLVATLVERCRLGDEGHEGGRLTRLAPTVTKVNKYGRASLALSKVSFYIDHTPIIEQNRFCANSPVFHLNYDHHGGSIRHPTTHELTLEFRGRNGLRLCE